MDIIKKYFKFWVGILYFCAFSSLAVDVPIKISGTVKVPPCIINKNEKIIFNFKTVQIDKVNNHDNSITKEISIDCQYYQGKPYINVVGDKLANAPNNVLNTKGNTGLGIALYQGSSVNNTYPLIIGNNINSLGNEIINGLSGKGQKNGIFSITAVPYALNTSNLAPGKFESTAKIVITYN
ncbi:MULTISPECIES: fimbrial protein [unclassified Providencia]|uniref:fimbrial protein n=1 Tax=unclassified Providencia TaxID=2633465 RepID=UPI00234BAF26|nr:fimbrial protein [Providencia sp. PROV164]